MIELDEFSPLKTVSQKISKALKKVKAGTAGLGGASSLFGALAKIQVNKKDEKDYAVEDPDWLSDEMSEKEDEFELKKSERKILTPQE